MLILQNGKFPWVVHSLVDSLTNQNAWWLFQPITRSDKTKRSLPVSREARGPPEIGQVPKGKITNVRLSELFAKRLEDPDTWTNEALAKHYQLDQEALSAVLKYFNDYAVVKKRTLPRPEEPTFLGWYGRIPAAADEYGVVPHGKEIIYGVKWLVNNAVRLSGTLWKKTASCAEIIFNDANLTSRHLTNLHSFVYGLWKKGESAMECSFAVDGEKCSLMKLNLVAIVTIQNVSLQLN